MCLFFIEFYRIFSELFTKNFGIGLPLSSLVHDGPSQKIRYKPLPRKGELGTIKYLVTLGKNRLRSGNSPL